MAAASKSLLKYNDPVLVNKNINKSLKRPARYRFTFFLLHHPQERSLPTQKTGTSTSSTPFFHSGMQWTEGNDLWMQQVSSAASTREDVIKLGELLDTELQQRRAREKGICPIRRELYSQCFDELIRQEIINCPERGLLLFLIRDEIQMNIAAHKTLYESGIAFGLRETLRAEQGKADTEKRISDLEEENEELKKQLAEKRAKYDTAEKRAIGRQQLEEKRHNDEIQALKRTIQQLKDQIKAILALKE
ncbi:axonemal dynein light intermediate polypeptide 1 isoform X1 [Takifugu rubripes]|uniref:axonemal dynein light intermediate polypeptide 1 isoform X1 n=1 Tax=Takifugu rubripes TaxID=31033 RepID=UPI001145FD1B|nr:axonemal dynein light intermediate polypeptide 1 isoform X1 [Takifugu rubripes]